MFQLLKFFCEIFAFFYWTQLLDGLVIIFIDWDGKIFGDKIGYIG